MEQNVITVSKTATKQVAANQVRISITVLGEAKKYAAAIDAADENSKTVIKAFDAIDGVELSDGGMNVTAVRAEKKTVGYRAAQVYSAEFAFDKAVLQSVSDALGGLEAEWRVAFTHKDNGERKQLLQDAVKAARADAEAIAEAASVKLGTLSKVEYSSDGGRPMMLRSAAFDGASSPEPERITLSESVVCSWEIVG